MYTSNKSYNLNPCSGLQMKGGSWDMGEA
jgi:hypothetical protein